MNVANLEISLVQKINNSTSTLDTLIYSKALQELKTGTVTTVDSFSGLPNPTASLISQLFYVKNEEAFYHSVFAQGIYKWVLLRKDVYPLRTWGGNGYGQLGDGSTTARSSPGTVAGGGTNWCTVSFSKTGCHSAGIKTDGTLWTWGLNTCSQLGDGTTTNRSSPGTTAGGGTNWCCVSVGSLHTIALKTDGSLWSWGNNGYGRLGDGSTTTRSVPVTVAGGGNNWCAICAEDCHNIALKTDGSLWTWGGNGQGRLGNGGTSARSSPGTIVGILYDWCSISAGTSHSAAITKCGVLYTWGDNTCGKLGDGTTTSRTSPVSVAGGGSNWCRVSSGFCHTIAVKTDGTVWTWGGNGYGELGDGTTTSRSSPGTVAGGGTNWNSVSAGMCHSAAIKTDGIVWTWGANAGNGRLGDGTTTARSSPGTTAGCVSSWRQIVSAGRCSTASV
jgi:alpha-tubulin suppressor-like RCC1 family protein